MPRRTLDAVQERCLYALLVLLPFSKAAIELAFVVLFASWLLARLQPSTRRESLWFDASSRGMVWALGGFVAVCIASIFVSRFPEKSINGLISKWLEYLLFFVIAADLGRRPQVPERAAAATAVSAALVVIEAVWQELFGRGLFRGYPLSIYTRMTGPYENPIDFAIYLMVAIPLLLTYGAASRGRRRAAVFTLVGLLVVCFARTEAFGTWIGLALAFLVVGSARRSLRRPALIMLLILVVSGGFFLTRVRRLHHLLSPAETGKIDRVHMWTTAIRMIQDRPLLGHGLNTFMANYLDYWVGGEQQPRYAHNCYLQVAAETGLLGLAMFLAILSQLMARLWAGLRRTAAGTAPLAVGFLVGLLAFVIHAGIDTNFYSVRQAALFWTMAGLAYGLSERMACSASR